MAARMAAGLFAARIVVGDDDAVGFLRGDGAHHRPLAGVAVAAGAEHHDQPAVDIRPQRLQRLGERVGLVRVVDEDRRAVALAGEFEPALGAFELLQRREHRAGSLPVAMARPAAISAFSTWKSPTSGSRRLNSLPAMRDAQRLREAVDAGCRSKPDAVAVAADASVA